MLRAPHFLGVHTIALDASPLRLEGLRLWVGAATHDGGGADLFSSVMSGAAMGAGSPIGAQVGGAYVRAALDGHAGPPLHIWLGASEHAAWAYRIGGYRLRILSVAHEALDSLASSGAALDVAARASLPRQLGARDETVLVGVAVDRLQLPAPDAVRPSSRGDARAKARCGGAKRARNSKPAVRSHRMGEEMWVWLSTQHAESVTLVGSEGARSAPAAANARRARCARDTGGRTAGEGAPEAEAEAGAEAGEAGAPDSIAGASPPRNSALAAVHSARPSAVPSAAASAADRCPHCPPLGQHLPPIAPPSASDACVGQGGTVGHAGRREGAPAAPAAAEPRASRSPPPGEKERLERDWSAGAGQPAELTLSLSVRPAAQHAAPSANAADFGLFGVPDSHWHADVDLMAISDTAEAYETVQVAPGGLAATEAKAAAPPSSRSRRLRALTADAQRRNGRGGVWTVGEYQVRIAEVTGHFVVPAEGGAAPAAGAGAAFVSRYPILSLAVCMHVQHVGSRDAPGGGSGGGAAVGGQGEGGAATARAQAMAMAAALEDLLL